MVSADYILHVEKNSFLIDIFYSSSIILLEGLKKMMLKDEMCVLKTMIVSIDDENALLVSMQYHSECDGHIDSSLSESCRRWYAVAAKKS